MGGKKKHQTRVGIFRQRKFVSCREIQNTVVILMVPIRKRRKSKISDYIFEYFFHVPEMSPLSARQG